MFRNAAVAAVLFAMSWALSLESAAANVAESGRCMELQALTDYLRDAYKEERLAVADHENGNRIYLFASGNGTWTMVEITDGLGCVSASGTGWHRELTTQADSKPPV